MALKELVDRIFLCGRPSYSIGMLSGMSIVKFISYISTFSGLQQLKSAVVMMFVNIARALAS